MKVTYIYETRALHIDLYFKTITVLAAATAMPIMHNHPFVDIWFIHASM
jgi:hypothetical protein